MVHLIPLVFILAGCGDHDSNEKVKLDGHGMEGLEVLGVMQEFPLTPYLKLRVRENGEDKEIMFNSQESTIAADSIEAQLKNPYTIHDNLKGIITIQKNDAVIFKTDLKKEDGFKTTDELSFKWSNTERYLIISQDEKDLVIDLEKGKKLPSPIDGILNIVWSLDDKTAVVEGYSGVKEPTPTYRWDVEYFTTEAIGKFDYSDFYWSPDHSDLYRVQDDYPRYSVNRYSHTDHSWTKDHTTDRQIEDGTFKALNNGKFIYVCSEKSKQVFRPRQYFAVMIDVTHDKISEIPLGNIVLTTAFWSYDNKYIYYSEPGGFFKVKTGF